MERPFRVLVVESNPADSYLITEALKQAGLTTGVLVMDDSQKALDYVNRECDGIELILLDLNIEPISGLEVLPQIRRSKKFGWVPVAMISGSENRDDVRKAYQLGANCYITKSSNLEGMFHSIKTCYEFWSQVATLPSAIVQSAEETEK